MNEDCCLFEYFLDYIADAVMCRDTLRWGEGRFNHLTNYCYLKKITENTMANSLAALLTFDQLSCNFEDIGDVSPPRPHPQMPVQMHTKCLFFLLLVLVII